MPDRNLVSNSFKYEHLSQYIVALSAFGSYAIAWEQTTSSNTLETKIKRKSYNFVKTYNSN